MQSAKEKMANMASAAKEKISICGAKMNEKTEMARAQTEEEKTIAHEHRKVKEAQAKMELHQDKARHAEEKLRDKVAHLPSHGQTYGHEPPLMGAQYGQVGRHGHRPLGTAIPMAGTAVPNYPLGGNPTPPGHMRHYQS